MIGNSFVETLLILGYDRRFHRRGTEHIEPLRIGSRRGGDPHPSCIAKSKEIREYKTHWSFNITQFLLRLHIFPGSNFDVSPWLKPIVKNYTFYR